MADLATAPQTRDDALARYKALLKDLIDQRPSGTRQKLAKALGTHKSFISQVTNPALKVPLPAQHVQQIFSVCRFSNEERHRFLTLYRDAHPGQPLARLPCEKTGQDDLTITLPPFRNPDKRREAEDLIRDFAARVISLSKDAP